MGNGSGSNTLAPFVSSAVAEWRLVRFPASLEPTVQLEPKAVRFDHPVHWVSNTQKRTVSARPLADGHSSNQNICMPTSYPFVPKTNARLSEGDFWALPLVDGSYACGRVLQLPPKAVSGPGSKMQFLGALMDWHEESVPSVGSLEGSRALKRGVMHVKSIWGIGGAVIGNRRLSLEGIEPGLFIDGTDIRLGYDYCRACRTSDLKVLEAWSWWGWNVIWLLANHHFLGVDLSSDAEPTPRSE